MCGIGGVIQLDKRKTFSKETQLMSLTLLMELQDRGDHAWGVYIEKTGKKNSHLYCGKTKEGIKGELFKRPKSVDNFFNEDNGKVYLDGTNTILMHTRHQTHGSPDVNENNHPFNTSNYILAHNGVIRNSEEMLKKYHIKTDIECDSYAIVALIQHFHDNGKNTIDSIKEAVRIIGGSYACWLYDKEDSSLYLFRNTSPLEYIFDEKNGLLIFSSDDDYILHAYNDSNLKSTDVTILPRDKIFKLVKNELQEVGGIETTTSNTGSMVSPYYGGFNSNNYKERFSNAPTSDISKVNKSLKDLFIAFKLFEQSKGRIETVISTYDDKVVLIVEPPELIKKLDKSGFTKYRVPIKILNTPYTQYVISPQTNINVITSVFLNNINSTESVDFSAPSEIQLRDLAETLGCQFEIADNQYVFTYQFGTDVQKWVKTMLGRRGINFNKRKQITLNINAIHNDKLNKLLVDMKLRKEK